MIRQIMDGDFHTSLPIFNPTEERNKVVDFSMSIYDERTYWATKFPEPSSFSPMAVFAFSWEAILLLLSAVCFLGLLTFLLDFCHPKRQLGNTEPENDDSTFCTRLMRRSMDIGALLIQQGPSQNEYHTAAYYVIFGVWGLSCVVLIGIIRVYSSFILLTALAQKQKLPFDGTRSLARCVASGKCHLVAETLSLSYYDAIFTAEPGSSLYDVRKALEINTPTVIPSLSERAALVLDSPDVFNVMIVASVTYSLIAQEHAPCVFQAVQRNQLEYTAFPFGKNSSLRSLFDKAIMALQTNGVMFALNNKYVGAHIRSDMCTKSAIGSKPMSLETFIGPFVALLCGGCIAMLILLCEKLHFKRKGRNCCEKF